ncbi:DUF349 domain-containing protein [Fulvivirgaceae bacterium BMA12]|uniref:DUF349 domain-containing protein n=1 Tax=Agaribacillus aureus TaxID=3051825 RepID=A0ABT8KYB1_9BACT|nr:DUF349 domain-containing protein [Fulvivirgaceae bacterium BMA12]
MSKETEPSEEIKKEALNAGEEGAESVNDQNSVSTDENQSLEEEAQGAALNEDPEALATNDEAVEADDDQEKTEDTTEAKEEAIEEEVVATEPQATIPSEGQEEPVVQASDVETSDSTVEPVTQEAPVDEAVSETTEETEVIETPTEESTDETDAAVTPTPTETVPPDSANEIVASAQPAESISTSEKEASEISEPDTAKEDTSIQPDLAGDETPEETPGTMEQAADPEQPDHKDISGEKIVDAEVDPSTSTTQPATSQEITAAPEADTAGADEALETEDKQETAAATSESAAPTAEEPTEEEATKTEKAGEEEAGATAGFDDLGTADHEEEIHDDGDELVHADYTQYSKEELVRTIKTLTKLDDFKKLDVVLNIITPLFQEMKERDRAQALERYIEDGGSEEDFSYKNELDQKYDAYYKLIKERKHKFYGDLGRQKLENYQKATELLEKLRHLVDGEESTTSINAIKEIQEEWKATGQVPPQHVRNLWASYNALMDRFYDNRSIYFELKELDRKKNLVAKEELCVRAENLEKEENLRDAIKELNELHNEYKHIGPVPKAQQEALWQRFKAASDKVYARRKTHYDELKKDLEVNLESKAKLRDEVQPFAEFDSDRIVEWNKKTQEILEIQKRWEAIGGLPRERAHEVNKPFWSAFKRFFNNKNAFFKKLEGERGENLKLKEALVAKAVELKDSTDWNQTANELKKLQQEWRNIGPVPEKHRNEIYQRFKQACDTFFDNRRNSFKEVEKGYEENLKLKEDVCQRIIELAEEGAGDIGQLEALQEEWNNIGFVPKNAIRSSQEMFAKAVDKFITSSSLDEEEKTKLKITTKLTSLKGTPNANRKLNKKEFNLRRQITNLENDISLWKNNLEFFANSKNADQVREEFDLKIDNAKKELMELKAQLKIIKNI